MYNGYTVIKECAVYNGYTVIKGYTVYTVYNGYTVIKGYTMYNGYTVTKGQFWYHIWRIGHQRNEWWNREMSDNMEKWVTTLCKRLCTKLAVRIVTLDRVPLQSRYKAVTNNRYK